MLQVAGNGDRLSVISDQSSVASGQLRRETDRGKSGPADVVQPQNLAELQYVVRSCERLVVRGGGSKHALSAAQDGAMVLDMRGLRGIVEYVPDEFTFTALAGTPVSEVTEMLAEHGQYLPFDPPLQDAGATLGGTVAAGLSGPGRYRYGGVRDFILGVRFVDGQGNVVRGGGKVVKNAAGFDLPKLMTGSLGRLGVLVEVSFKVFPAPATYATVAATLPTMAEAARMVQQLAAAPVDWEALDIAPAPKGATLWARLGGLKQALPPRVARVQELLEDSRLLTPAEDEALWRRINALDFGNATDMLVKAALTARDIPALDAALAAAGAVRHYSAAGNLAWIAWPGSAHDLDRLLAGQRLPGLTLRGAAAFPLVGRRPAAAFLQPVKQTLDPAGRFPAFEQDAD
ncbi:MAG: FAD-binding protein [Anaerolineae bacterium]|nr:FAD-binding protein [Anaerolineae bacterium]